MPTSDPPGKLALAARCPDKKIAHLCRRNIHKHLYIIQNKVEMGGAT